MLLYNRLEIHILYGGYKSNTYINKRYIMTDKLIPFMINPKDTEDDPLTYRRLIDWLASTGWVEGHLCKRISVLDLPYLDDYIQEVWVQILEVPQDKLLSIWHKGKGKFTNYIKSIIMNNINSDSSILYKNIREPLKPLIHLDECGWDCIANNESATAHLKFTFFDKGKTETNYEEIKVKSIGYNQETQREV